MWSLALSVVGGCGSAFCVPVVAVENVEFALGEDGRGETAMLCLFTDPGELAEGTGFRTLGESGALSAEGTGRRRLRIEEAAEIGSVTTRWSLVTGSDVGSGCGGVGGGEC
jgi:hypothetical protein